jgi:hypothetical protein
VMIGNQKTNNEIKQIILDQTRLQMQLLQSQTAGHPEDTSRLNYNINCYDFFKTYKSKSNPDGNRDLPNFYKEQLNGFNSGMFKKH